MPSGSVFLVALLLPWLEVVIGTALLTGVHLLGASGLTLVLLAVFAVAQGAALSRGLTIGCGCLGGDEVGVVSFSTLARTMGYLVCAGLLFRFELQRPFRTAASRGCR